MAMGLPFPHGGKTWTIGMERYLMRCLHAVNIEGVGHYSINQKVLMHKIGVFIAVIAWPTYSFDASDAFAVDFQSVGAFIARLSVSDVVVVDPYMVSSIAVAASPSNCFDASGTFAVDFISVGDFRAYQSSLALSAIDVVVADCFKVGVGPITVPRSDAFAGMR